MANYLHQMNEIIEDAENMILRARQGYTPPSESAAIDGQLELARTIVFASIAESLARIADAMDAADGRDEQAGNLALWRVE